MASGLPCETAIAWAVQLASNLQMSSEDSSDSGIGCCVDNNNCDSRSNSKGKKQDIGRLSELGDSIAPVRRKLSAAKDGVNKMRRHAQPPTQLWLLAPINLSLHCSGSQIIRACRNAVSRGDYSELFGANEWRPEKNDLLKKLEAHLVDPGQCKLRTPSVLVQNSDEAYSSDLRTFCFQCPIAVIRGLATVLKIDLGLFTSKSLVELAPDQHVEVRTQIYQSSDDNVDTNGKVTWRCVSTRSFTTVKKYAQYQANSFLEHMESSLCDEEEEGKGFGEAKLFEDNFPDSPRPVKQRKEDPYEPTMLKFGTNVDLSDEKRWSAQLEQIRKLPNFLRVQPSCDNLLSFVGHIILGVNTVQLYMKVPGSRTPAHHENNCFASVNLNIGPGDCEWFGVDYGYWVKFQQLCTEHGVEFIKDSWWPTVDDLVKEGIPYFKFTQRPGDIVWVGPGTIHWVQAKGFCNNVAWNVGPTTALQMELAVERYELNKLDGFKSIIPMTHLCWQLAKDAPVRDFKLYETIKGVLLRTLAYSTLLLDYASTVLGLEPKHQAKVQGEVAHYCQKCELEVWNVLFVRESQVSSQRGVFEVYCFHCAQLENEKLSNFTLLYQFQLDDLCNVYNNFRVTTTSTAKAPLLSPYSSSSLS